MTTAHNLGTHVAAHVHGSRGIEAVAGPVSTRSNTGFSPMPPHLRRCMRVARPSSRLAYTGIRKRLGTGVYTPQVEAKIRETLSVVGQGRPPGA